ncbi:T9SS type A sorting domain-containing protein [Hymenobacter sp. BT683]|uniref:T9SS type A sorting domain-containing protein n=1 Tax=Hymenobacter jeongseonensis TaxID=2791027 RepID=A0ABS0ID80_9BACT|nr:GEVED domain-containing protein [Hymenobacter jeongseonensis]MBF9236312.1 T9SS type A sorting domain-containing protein [Hymenobacter jeongseonensis]
MKITHYALTLCLLGSVLLPVAAHAQDSKSNGGNTLSEAINRQGSIRPVIVGEGPNRTCASMEALAAQIAADPAMARRLSDIEKQSARYASQPSNALERTTAVTLTIPVVVHVLYNTSAQNVSDAQIASQIAVLNEDFQKLNADVSKTPSAFAGLAANVNIGFTLAKRDPSGNATTGITRKQVTQTSWGTDDRMKSSSTGGTTAWNTSQYLNIWVCNLSGGVLGYAQFPGGAAATDGVVILTTGFGRNGSAAAPFNLGRTATHEVGHWLNLRHIWGDASCGNDLVSDTPTQQTSNTGCPTFPKRTCGNTTNGDMFMNYMDYTNDACMYMFSTGQSSRMNALFATGGARVSLKTSLGGTAPGGTTPPPTGTPTYCASKGTSVAYEWLDLVQLGSINRTSGQDAGYYNGTALSTSVTAGAAYTINFSVGFAGTAYTEYVKVYADWNQNGVFTDAGELVVSAAGSTSAATRSASFTVPAGAKNGSTRLRIIASDNSATTSCNSYSYGETEDYTLNVGGGVARTDGSSTARLSTASEPYSLFPNPATNVLRIARPASADPAQPFSVRVHDLRGSEVRGLSFADGELNVSKLSPGIYLLTLSDGAATTHQRFVKE